MTDEQLVTGCIENNPIAQQTLYEKFARKMMGVCLRYTNSVEEAEDVMQNGFVRVFDRMDSFKGKGSLEGWIRRVLVNTALDHYRKNKKLQDNVAVDDVAFKLTTGHTVLESMAAEDLLGLVQSLPDGFRTVFNMYAIEGYSHKEIGNELGVSESTSKSQYSRARAHLQKMIEQLEENVK